MKRKAVILDRDDTIVVNVPYNGDPAKVVLTPRASEALELLDQEGFVLAIASNQSGVGRGIITKEQVKAVNDEMIRQLGRNFFAGIYNCYEAPGQPGSELRKPHPHLLLKACEEHGLDPASSYMVGDRIADMKGGRAAGMKSILLTTEGFSEEKEEARGHAHHVAKDLMEAAQWILADESERGKE